MADIRTDFRGTDPGLPPAADWSVEGGGLAMDGGFETAITLSIFTERDALPGDEIPEGEAPRKWWGQTYWALLLTMLGLVVPEGFQLGSRLWLLRRAKETEETRSRAIFYVRECLAWLVTFKIAQSVDIDAEWTGPGELSILVVVIKPDGIPVRYQNLWRKAA